MASNPMQRKSRNSFLLGIIVTLLITGVIIAALLLMLKQKNDEIKAEQDAKKTVYTLKQDVKAGQILTKNMFEKKPIHQDSIPSDATSVTKVIESWFLQTKEGEAVYTDQYGLYIDRTNSDKSGDTIIEIFTNNGADFVDSNGNKVAKGDYFVAAAGLTQKVNSTENANAIVDEHGMFIVNNQGNDKIVRVYQESATEEFYLFEIDTTSINTNGESKRIKKYIDIKNVPVLARVDMKKNTVITQKLVVQSDEQVTDDTRQQEYNVVMLPVDLMSGDYIDVRLMTPDGQDFIVISKALVDIPKNADGTYVADTMRINIREDEILTMSSAIVEAAGLKGSKLYASRYVEPAMQEGGQVTYTPNAAVTAQFEAYMTQDMNGDGIVNSDDYINLVKEAEEILQARYSDAAKRARNEFLQKSVDTAIQNEEYLENIQEKAEIDIGTALTNRKQYLETLN